MYDSIAVYEDSGWQRLLPLVYFRAVFQLRCGMSELLDRLLRVVHQAQPTATPRMQLWCRGQLQAMVARQTGIQTNCGLTPGTLLLNGRGLWNRIPAADPETPCWVGTVGSQQSIACIVADDHLASRLQPEVMIDEVRLRTLLAGLPRRDVSADVQLFDWPWQIVNANETALHGDWADYQNDSPPPPQIRGCHLLAPESIRLGAGTRIKPLVVIDAEQGPVWIGQNVTIMPHTYVQGPACIGDGCLLQPGAVVHAGTTIGPCCKVGGEVEASIMQGYSNKQHDGFLGHSYVCSWVNIAADCINSDLKNTYGQIRVPINGREVDSGEMFVGMFVGDFSKAGINVSFPTGAVIGFCSSVFAPRSPKFVPSFAWLDADKTDRFDADRGLQLAAKVMARRAHKMTDDEQAVFRFVRQQAVAIELESQLPIEISSASVEVG